MGFPRLLSIFYCTFHPIQGPKVLYEVPEGSILSKTAPLVDFDSISEYLIPKVELCSKLVTISTPTCKVIGYPINLEHKKFQRNALMFNLAFVFDKDAEISSYEPVVRKMARVLKALEKECEFLSRQTKHAMVDSITTTSSISTIVATIAPTFAPSSTLSSTLIPTPEGQANATSNAPTPSTESAQANASSTLEPPVQGMASMSVTDATAPSNSTNSSPATGATGSPAIFSPLPSNAIVLSADPTSASTLHPPAPSAGAVQIPPTTSNITSTAFMASPPSIANGSIASVLTAPLSSSPFPPAKSSSISSQKQITNSQPLLHDSHTDGSGMQNLIEQLIEDLNSYCECQIPIDSANTINLKLFPTYPNPSPVYDYQVPIATVNLEALTDVNWDMTMQRITGHINGVNSVKRIAEYADVETGLARMCMGHLL
ncbi:Nitrogen permease regulator 2 [Lunasporangiospora selenospora]|uniref:Nitrogen permease regulator 2 n=1 Tax=Lunasporangiospora selenospora TaxID=979761 RepID=A0A9P6FLD3_9FUNG|nr:Nitrogen permease regulator 2 [Lunasporangiospora selenospora]